MEAEWCCGMPAGLPPEPSTEVCQPACPGASRRGMPRHRGLPHLSRGWLGRRCCRQGQSRWGGEQGRQGAERTETEEAAPSWTPCRGWCQSPSAVTDYVQREVPDACCVPSSVGKWGLWPHMHPIPQATTVPPWDLSRSFRVLLCAAVPQPCSRALSSWLVSCRAGVRMHACTRVHA